MNKFNLKNHVKQHFSIMSFRLLQNPPLALARLFSFAQSKLKHPRIGSSYQQRFYHIRHCKLRRNSSSQLPLRDNWQNINALGFVVPSSSLEHNRCKVSSSKESFKISRPVTGSNNLTLICSH